MTCQCQLNVIHPESPLRFRTLWGSVLLHFLSTVVPGHSFRLLCLSVVPFPLVRCAAEQPNVGLPPVPGSDGIHPVTEPFTIGVRIAVGYVHYSGAWYLLALGCRLFVPNRAR
ncbi:hypothetical protein B0T13DRAFT_458914 [Neurospora crassa]|nr:hypothetical protein B0T13DRAFT_458914 [Neurospora crassa]